jgi:GT2 family glycosyltransferase
VSLPVDTSGAIEGPARAAGSAKDRRSPKPPADANDSGANCVGWARVDGDHVLRGWMTDRNDPDRRFRLEILIDGDSLGIVTADRLDPKLVALGEGDGRYAFAAMIPARYRDGKTHRFEVRACDVDFVVRTKNPEFDVPDGAPVMRLELESVTLSAVNGHLVGGSRKATLPLEVWRDAERLDMDLDVRWIIGGAAPAFRISLSGDLAGQLAGGDLILASPGMIEGTPEAVVTLPRARLSVTAEEDAEGRITAVFSGQPAVENGTAIQIRFEDPADGSELGGTTAQARHGRVIVDRPDRLAGRSISLTAWHGDRPLAPATRLRPANQPYLRNGSFRLWTGDRPADWEIAAGVRSSRDFHAFPARVAADLAVSGDAVQLEPDAGVRHLLSQQISGDRVVDGSPALAVLARASNPCRLRLSLEDGRGRSCGVTELDIVEAGTWELAVSELELEAEALPPLWVRLSLADGHADSISVAGIALGTRAFDPRPAQTAAPFAPENLAANADLKQWPNGLVLSDLTGRIEVAEGWFCTSGTNSGAFSARAVVSEDDVDGVALGVAADTVTDAFRVEVRLDPAAEALATGRLALEIGIPAAVRRLVSQGEQAPPAHVMVDRILVVRRETLEAGNRISVRDRHLGVIARRLLVAVPFHRYEIDFDLRGQRRAEPLSWDASLASVQTAELLLVLEFRRPFAAAIRNLSFGARVPRVEVPPASEHLALEDRAIAAQTGLIRGLEPWGHGPVLRSRGQGPARPATPSRRWRWSAGAGISIEVVVCMHNAADETLACLDALSTTTAVPHTVRIVDDGSDAVMVQRVAAFVEARPWMRLDRNGSNLGYTATADAALRASEAELVVLLNSDTVVTPGWLEGLLECMVSDDRTAMVGPVSNAATFQSVPVLREAGGRWKTNLLPEAWSPDDMARAVAAASSKAFPEAPLLNGFCTLIRRSVFLELGGFNVAAFPQGYGEENDLCLRVTKAGYRLRIADHVYVYHAKSASFGDKRRAELAKRGGAAFQKLHPDVDIKALTDRFGQDGVLARLRADIAAVYETALTAGRPA